MNSSSESILSVVVAGVARSAGCFFCLKGTTFRSADAVAVEPEPRRDEEGESSREFDEDGPVA